MEFRPYQQTIIEDGTKRLSRLRIIMLAMEVRTGKTLTSLGIADKMDITSVLFITKKKAISSIEADYKLLNPSYTLNVTNYESVHKVSAKDYDLIIVDEYH
jgi:predicted helicase